MPRHASEWLNVFCSAFRTVKARKHTLLLSRRRPPRGPTARRFCIAQPRERAFDLPRRLFANAAGGWAVEPDLLVWTGRVSHSTRLGWRRPRALQLLNAHTTASLIMRPTYMSDPSRSTVRSVYSANHTHRSVVEAISIRLRAGRLFRLWQLKGLLRRRPRTQQQSGRDEEVRAR